MQSGDARCCRAGAALVLVGAATLPLAVPARGQEGLELRPATGRAGSVVEAAQHELPDWCTAYELRWGGLFGARLGRDDDLSEGSAALSFRVPATEPGTYQVSGSCPLTAGAIPVGQATFEVVPGSATSSTTATVPGPTVTPSTATTHPHPPTSRPLPAAAPPPSTTTTSAGDGYPAPAPDPETAEECEQQARQAAAHLAYEPKRRMTVGETYDVETLLALSKDDLAGAEPLPSSSPTTVVLIEGVRCTVVAELTGSTFDVTPDEPRAQSFIGTRVLTWQWQVTPRRTGPGHKLLLRLQSEIHELDGSVRDGPAFFHKAVINVTTEPASVPNRVGRWINGVVGNEVVRYLLLPGGSGVLATLAWRTINRRREGSGSAQGGRAGVGPGVPG